MPNMADCEAACSAGGIGADSGVHPRHAAGLCVQSVGPGPLWLARSAPVLTEGLDFPLMTSKSKWISDVIGYQISALRRHSSLCSPVPWPLFRCLQLITLKMIPTLPRTYCSLRSEWPAPAAGGMPDLLLWNNERKALMLSEVKSPRDTLKMQQLAWLAALSDAGIRVELLRVKEPPKQ